MTVGREGPHAAARLEARAGSPVDTIQRMLPISGGRRTGVSVSAARDWLGAAEEELRCIGKRLRG